MSDTYSCYRLSDGHLTGQTLSVPADQAQQNTPPGCGLVEGVWSSDRYRVDLATGSVVAVDLSRPADTVEIVWSLNEELHRWMPVLTFVGQRAEMQRSFVDALQALDRESGTDRAVRELLLSSSISPAARNRIQALEDKASALRASLERVLAAQTEAELALIDPP